jgi:glycosyltransferase involved in cell wall biosynthesis
VSSSPEKPSKAPIVWSTSRDEPLVSVVTPVYNTDKYLTECIESVLAQTYANWEYVISDNSSTDRTLEIANSYAARDPRIRVHEHDEHLGVLQNWNRSLQEMSAASAYCKVVHADDWLFPECLERMVGLAEDHPRVGIVGSYRLEEDRVTLDRLPPSRKVIPGRELARSTLLGGPYPYLFGAPTQTLFRADLVRARDPFYDESHLQSDTGACYDLLRESDFGFVHQVLTFTRRHNETVTASVRRKGTYLPGHLWLHFKYGPMFLSSDEYERRLAVWLAVYGWWLVRQAPRMRDRELRNYHVEFLGTLRQRVAPAEVRRGVAHQVRRTFARRAGRSASR